MLRRVSGGRRRDFPGWRMVWGLAVTETISYGVLFYAFAVFVTPARQVLHTSTAVLDGALSLALAVNGAAAIAVGRWLDTHGARVLMTCGSLLAAVSVAGWALADNLPQLYLAFVGIGLAGAAVLYEPAFAVINTWFRRDRGKALLTLTLVAGFAQTIFIPAAQALLDNLGYRNALLVLAVVVGLCALPHALLLRREPFHLGLRPDGDVSADIPTETTIEKLPPNTAASSGVATYWRHASVRWLTVATVLETLAVTIVAIHLVAYLLDSGVHSGPAALAAGAIGILSVTGRVVLTSLAARIGLGRLTATMLAGQAGGVAALFALPRPVSLVTFVVLFGAGFGVMTIARPALLGTYVPVEAFASVSGRQALAANAGRVLAPVAGGLAITNLGYGVTFIVVAGCALTAAVALLRAERTHDLMSSPA